MARLSRRHLLQGAGATLAALGWSSLDVMRQGDRFGRVLAQPTNRKLALLVGINAYPRDSLFAPLQGCLNDVELQYHLLVHRFGFQPSDIVKLTNAKATRQDILTAFEEHLINQARPGDVVVFHFSGHGSRVVDPDQDFPDGLNSTLVPIDSRLPEGFPRQGGPVEDITGHTLFLLGSALQTDNVTLVLDSCHSGGGTRGNLVVRARPGGTNLEMSPVERVYQERWLSQLNLSPSEFIRRRRAGIARGVAIASAKRDQYAADTPFQDFYAGAFSYVMTQYLWQQTGSTLLGNTLANVARSTTQLSFNNQEPQFEIAPGSSYEGRPLYFTDKVTPPAEAVVTKVQGNEAEIWLGGIDPQSLEAFQTDAILAGVDERGQSRGLLQIISRQGLQGRGRLLDRAMGAGALLQEQVRGVPTDITLRVGVDTESLSEAEQTQVVTAIATIPRIQAVPLHQGEAHYILGRLTVERRQDWSAATEAPPVGSLGLFSQGLEGLPGAFGLVQETVTAAVDRLRPKLRSLLAARIVKLILNPGSSRLNLSVTMIPEGGSSLVASAFTVRGRGGPPPSAARPGVPEISLNQSIQFQIQNNEPQDLYLSVLVIDVTGEMTVIFPNQWTASADVTRLAAGATLLLPDPNRDSFRLVTQEPRGATEVLIIASSQPLDHGLRALREVATRSGTASGPVGMDDPAQIVGDLLTDVATTRGTPTRSVQSVDASQLAALSLTFDVV
ncbi:caspase family protein [Leptolyngbya sp. PCC 6406]|uniref:caspase family protein n=1 Tax=Leptolyngbya sp. PCC 6406 TaxID=1173264 RepID=UPI0002AC4ED3|nr:caspase family protein [Leptolyngbya sp. PCC 6406]